MPPIVASGSADAPSLTETSQTELKGAFKLGEGLLGRMLAMDREKVLAALKRVNQRQ